MKNLVQTKNPRTDRYVKIDRDEGKIIETKKTKGPYKNIPIVRKRKIREIMSKEEDLISYSEKDMIAFGDFIREKFPVMKIMYHEKKDMIDILFKEWLKQK